MPARLLTDYIKIYDDALKPEHCRSLIERFEASAERTPRQADKGYSFVQLDISKHWPDQHRIVTDLLSAYFKRYQEELDVRRFWPSRYFYEHLRIQRYLPGGRDSFPTHVDVYNSAAAARFATAIIYLNATAGGETVFPQLDFSIVPAAGKLAIFPPLWTFPHEGRPPLLTAKYILHTYLLYPPA